MELLAIYAAGASPIFAALTGLRTGPAPHGRPLERLSSAAENPQPEAAVAQVFGFLLQIRGCER